MIATITRLVRSTRPMPPTMAPDWFEPAPELGEWASATFVDPAGPLHNPRHLHLLDAEIGWLWTTAEAANKDRRIAGECRLIGPAQRKWSSAMARFQLERMFGLIPDFVITIDADIATLADDWTFCALIEHELCHAAQDVDAFGDPRFTREGQPLFRLVAHDVEEFVEVVQRYGARATGVSAMVEAANRGPSIGAAAMDMACGTCARRVA
jgi:hypothetical protein